MPDTERKIPELCSPNQVGYYRVGSRKGGAAEMSTFRSQ